MVKELMQSNRQLRDTIDQFNDSTEKNSSEIWHLQVENRDLRDRIEILESVIASQPSDFDSLDWRKLLLDDNADSNKPQTAPMLKSSNSVVNEMATELIDTKKQNRQLEEQILQLQHSLKQSQSQQYPPQMMQQKANQQYYPQSQNFQNDDDYFYQQQNQRGVQQAQIYGGPNLDMYGGSGQKRSQSNNKAGGQPKNKQEALKMLNEMMNKRTQNKVSGHGQRK